MSTSRRARFRVVERRLIWSAAVALLILVVLNLASGFSLEWALHTRRHRLTLANGALTVTWRSRAIPTTCPAAALFQSPPTTPATDVVLWGDPPIAAWFVPGFAWRRAENSARIPLRPYRYTFDAPARRAAATVSFVLPTLAVAALLIVLVPHALLNRRRRRNVCAGCGHLLSGIHLQRCPECGAAIPLSSQWACEFVLNWPRPFVRSARAD